MIQRDVVEKAVRDVINSILGGSEFSIRPRQPGAPRKKSAYCIVDLISNLQIHDIDRTFENEISGPDVIETISDNRELIFSVSFYRAGSRDNADRVSRGLHRTSITDFLETQGLGLVDVSSVRSIPELFEDTWEERAQIDMTFLAVGTDSETMRSVERVEIELEHQAEAKIHTEMIEVQ